MRSKLSARLGLAVSVLVASSALALLVPLSAQAYSGDAITISNASTQIAVSGATRELHVAFDVAFTDPVNGTGDIGVLIRVYDGCGSSNTSSSLMDVTGSRSVALTMTLPAQGYVEVLLTPNDGSGGPGAATSLIAHSDPQDSTAPIATVHPDSGGDSGYVTVTTGVDLVDFTVVSGVWDGSSFPSGTVTTIPACSSVDIPFSGLAPNDVFEVHSTDLLGQPIATYTAPTPASVGAVSAPSAAGPTAGATVGAAAVAEDELAYTGWEAALPLLSLALLLLGAGGCFTVLHLRRVG